ARERDLDPRLVEVGRDPGERGLRALRIAIDRGERRDLHPLVTRRLLGRRPQARSTYCLPSQTLVALGAIGGPAREREGVQLQCPRLEVLRGELAGERFCVRQI